MHRPLIIVIGLLVLGIGSFFILGGVETVETTNARPTAPATAGAPRESVIAETPAQDTPAEPQTPAVDVADVTATEPDAAETALPATETAAMDTPDPATPDVAVAAPESLPVEPVTPTEPATPTFAEVEVETPLMPSEGFDSVAALAPQQSFELPQSETTDVTAGFEIATPDLTAANEETNALIAAAEAALAAAAQSVQATDETTDAIASTDGVQTPSPVTDTTIAEVEVDAPQTPVPAAPLRLGAADLNPVQTEPADTTETALAEVAEPAQPTVTAEPVAETATVAPELVAPLDDVTIEVASLAPQVSADISNFVAPTTSLVLDQSPTFDATPTRSRAPTIVGLDQPAVASVSIDTSAAPLPQATQDAPTEVAIFAPAGGQGSLLLTATAMGADGVLRPSAVGSLSGIVNTTATPQPTAAPQPQAQPAAAPAAPRVRAPIRVTPGILDAPQPAAPVTTEQVSALPLLANHTVRAGDTLARLAIQYYGDRDAFIYIYEANKDLLAQPEQISPGQTLRIPALPQ